MKVKNKTLGLLLAAALLVTATVFGTMAYLTDITETVNNTFSVGKVSITLDEAKVDVDGTAEGADRVTANEYKLMPGHEYTKDPTVHFASGSEASYLFVKVENSISDIEAEGNTIADQIVANGWTALDGVDDVYYKQVDAAEADVDYVVFESFTVGGAVTADTLADYEGVAINITAYAVQVDGFDSASDAWTATFGAN